MSESTSIKPFFTYVQGNCPEPAKFFPSQFVVDYRDYPGVITRHYTTEECGHPEPYEHIYEVRMAFDGGLKSFYESELHAARWERVCIG